MRAMKDSGIEWIGEIPEEWYIAKLKNIIRVLTDYTANGSFADIAKNVTYLDHISYARLVRLTDLRQSLNNRNGVYVDEQSYNYLAKSSLVEGDILVANVGAYSGLFVEMPKFSGYATLAPNMFLIRANDRVRNHFLYYLGVSDAVFSQLKERAASAAQPKLNKTDVKTVKIAIPSIIEQDNIGAYLDSKCTKIDSIIAKEQEVIAKLQEYKLSLITEKVTKGLNPNAEMKDSGIEWMGKVPKHWILGELKMFAKLYNGQAVESEVDDNTDATPVYGSGGVFKYTENSLFEGEAVLFGRKGTVGKPIYVNCRFWTVDTMYYLITNEMLLPKFAYYQLTAFDWNPLITKTAIPSVVGSDVTSSKFAIPSTEEQMMIGEYLDSKCVVIDATIAKKQALIKKFTEYKKSLIYEVVTGKKEV